MDIESLKQVLLKNPGDRQFVELAEYYKQRKDYHQAMQICLAGLSVNPGALKGRLLLAQLFYEQEFYPFAITELERLRSELPTNTAIISLLEKLNPTSILSAGSPVSQENIVAETDFDFSDLDSLEDEETK